MNLQVAQKKKTFQSLYRVYTGKVGNNTVYLKVLTFKTSGWLEVFTRCLNLERQSSVDLQKVGDRYHKERRQQPKVTHALLVSLPQPEALVWDSVHLLTTCHLRHSSSAHSPEMSLCDAQNVLYNLWTIHQEAIRNAVRNWTQRSMSGNVMC